MQAIDVVLVTWPNHPQRIVYFARTLMALKARLTATGYRLNWWCSSESERDPKSTWHGEELETLCRESGITLRYRPEGLPASLGAGMNAALRLGQADLVFLVQDDYELLDPLDLAAGADLMTAQAAVDMIRYSYYCHPEHGTKFVGPVPDGPPGYRMVDLYATWPYGDDPALRRRDLRERFPYIEGGPHGCSEGFMLHCLVQARAGIAAADRCYFAHFGEVAAVPLAVEYRERAVSR